jgi:hypothetical protein
MKALGELACAIGEVVESQARSLRRGVARLVTAIVLLAVGGLLVLVGLALAVWGIYGVLEPHIGAGGAALVGAAVALLAAILTMIAGKWSAH